jgi:hypothetical protein
MQPTKKRKHKTRSIMITKPKTRPKNKFGIDYFKKRTKINVLFFKTMPTLFIYVERIP